MYDGIYLVDCKKVHSGIQRYIKNHPEHLLFEIMAICTECKDTKTGNATPIAWECNQADCKDQNIFDRFFNFGTMGNSEHDQTPCKGPHHAGLVQNISVIEGDKGLPIQIAGGEENISEMGDEKNRNSLWVYRDIFLEW